MYETILPILLALPLVLYFWQTPIALVAGTFQKVLANPQASELLRFIFLGTVVEAGRQLGQLVYDYTGSLFVVRAEFGTGDFAYDWVTCYMDSQRVWHESRSFKVVARNAALRPKHGAIAGKALLGATDGHPDPVYEPAQASPALFRWKGYWISVNKPTAGYAHYDTGNEVGGKLVISILGGKRQVLDDFVNAAREYYIESRFLPRRVNPDLDKEPSGALMSAEFKQSDSSYEWMLAYLRSANVNALQRGMHFTISTKQSDVAWGEPGTPDKHAVRFMPAHATQQQFLFRRPNTGRSTWLQVVVKPGDLNWSTNAYVGGAVSIILHTTDRSVLADLIETARQTYLEHGVSRVNVHLADNRGEWAKTVSKSRRPMSTLILPIDVKEMLLHDAREFLDSEQWYNEAGIPHRRGYLLYGEPGTGKSSTIHALAGELGLEIYFVSLANPGIDDYTLAKLISDTPARCILLIEDIDCAFPSRDADADEDDDPALEQPLFDKDGKSMPRNSSGPTLPKSNVTLSGLLNVLDSVSSEEGRLMFATTNHIENLDSALIRAGRMDVKIQYRLADVSQLEAVFMRFFPLEHSSSPDVEFADPGQQHPSSRPAPYTSPQLAEFATAFAKAVPAHTYSIAQIQGYLLTKKCDPVGALEGVHAWLVGQEEERRAMAELKAKRKEERRRRREQREREAKEREAKAKLAEQLDSEGPVLPVLVNGGKVNGIHSDAKEHGVDDGLGNEGHV
uniref:P-loop containing nucleoside triphosphate hydrolase protein n=1 Tax=Mycena chlorophos TaxID=658473 RepID=A0ABQ0LFC1_MYCCL|nr:P-loop containing nucleoside triphosphate hydrolase protein [Mycena chlorophos]